VNAKGFTLSEMLVVLGILALIVALVPPFLAGGRARAEFAATTREIAAALREVRGQAIASGHAQALMIDSTAGTFRGGDRQVHHVPPGIRLSLVAGTGEQAGEQGLGSIRFFPDGSSTGGGVRLVQDKRESDVRVEWLTGRVSLETEGGRAER